MSKYEFKLLRLSLAISLLGFISKAFSKYFLASSILLRLAKTTP